MPISEEDLAQYRVTRRQRDAAAQEWQEKMQRTARNDARRVATGLKDELGAVRVILFGSTARDERLSPHSDLDLAVEGLTGMKYYRAVAQVQSVPAQMAVDLVRLESCSSSLRQTIKSRTTGRGNNPFQREASVRLGDRICRSGVGFRFRRARAPIRLRSRAPICTLESLLLKHDKFPTLCLQSKQRARPQTRLLATGQFCIPPRKIPNASRSF